MPHIWETYGSSINSTRTQGRARIQGRERRQASMAASPMVTTEGVPLRVTSSGSSEARNTGVQQTDAYDTQQQNTTARCCIDNTTSTFRYLTKKAGHAGPGITVQGEGPR